MSGVRSGREAGSLLLLQGTSMDKFYRIKISFIEPDKLSDGIKSQLRRELADYSVYLGIRFNPTTFNRSAAINSLELVHQCRDFAKQAFSEYGQVDFKVRSYPCTDEFMKSIIESDTRLLIQHMKDSGFTNNDNLHIVNVGNDSQQRSESRA